MNLYWIIFPLSLLLAGQYYASLRVWQLLPDILPLRIIAVVLMTVALSLFFVSMSGLSEKMSLSVAKLCYEVSTSWLIILLYLVMLFGVLDLALVTHLIPRNFVRESVVGSLAVLTFMGGIFSYAHWNYNQKRRVEITLDSRGKVQQPLKLVMISDLHLGYHNDRNDLRRWLELVKKEKPDALLIAGDLLDRAMRPVREEGSAEEFRQLGIPVYAVLGNHDYYAGESGDKEFCKQAGIQLLQDSVIYFGDVAIVGRDDRTNAQRKSLQDVMTGIDRTKYIIGLDHQPYHLEEVEQNGVDFAFAGHTHNGQVWPLNWIVKALYEKGFGSLTKGQTHYYISSGIGIWGAKFRIGTQSEYIVARIEATNN